MLRNKSDIGFKLLLSFLLSFTIVADSSAQTYGNEWIDYSQQYYSFKVASPSTPTNITSDGNIYTGVYRIEYSTLVNANIPLATIHPDNFQLFGREKEVPLHIVDGNDGSFDAGDYFLFYTQRNDGWLDSTLYDNPEKIGNAFYSLYNDTIEYFFTWNNSTNNLRYSEETEVDFSNYTPSDFIWDYKWTSYTSTYREGVRTSHASSSFYTDGEGWSNGHVNGIGGYTWNLSSTTLSNLYQGPGAPEIGFSSVHTSNSNAAYTGNGNHHVQYSFGPSNTVFIDSIWRGYSGLTLGTNIPNSALPSSGNTNFKISIIDDQGALTDYQSTSNWKFRYPRTTNLSNASYKEFEIENNLIESKIRLDLSNINFNNSFLLVHGDTPRIIFLNANGGNYSALFPNSASGNIQQVILQNSNEITTVNSLSPINGNGIFTNYLNTPGGIEEALIMIYHSQLESASLEYSAYREGISGGGYNTILANVNELYQQFGGGIEKHINGIRRFSSYIYQNSTTKPVGLFLMGKGIREVTVGGGTYDGAGTRKNSTRFQISLIPTFGYPSSDLGITSNLPGTTPWVPLIPTGRISSRTNQELHDYLEKIIEHEDNQNQNDIYDTPSKDWQKQILHFAGGSDISQQNQFQNYLNSYKSIIEDTLYGGNVHNIFKYSSDPLDPNILSGVTDRIEKGVSLMTYFGHASPTNSGFEINLDNPSNWNNQGKYPLMLVNSCYNGNIFQNSSSKSEEFVQTPNAGAIAYIASVSVGFDTYLNIFSKNLYKHFSQESYRNTLGLQMSKNVQDLESNFSNLILEVSTMQMVLNGDPMMKLNYHNKPEIELLEENVSFLPNNFNYEVDSLQLDLILTNLGSSITDTFTLEITRNFPSINTDSTYLFLIPSLHYKDTFSFKMPLQPNISIGPNIFTIRADIPNIISEQYDEIGNNQILVTKIITIDGISPVIPYEFAVVPYDSVTVTGSTTNPLAPFNNYRFEIDTTDTFNSPEHRYAIKSGLGGVKNVHPSEWLDFSSNNTFPLTCTDSTVYFWRVAIDSASPIWNESSFQYINGRTGWGQDHFFQFKNNNYFGVNYNRPSRDKTFDPLSIPIECNVIASSAGSDIYDNNYYVDGQLASYGIVNYTPKFHVCVIDPITHLPWGTKLTDGSGSVQNPNNDFGNTNNEYYYVWKFFTFNQNSLSQMDAFENMVLNEVPDGHYLLIYSPMTTRWDLINSIDSVDMYNAFNTLGSDSINGDRQNSTMAFFCKKGDPNSVVELFGQTPTDNVKLIASMVGNDYEGAESAPLIGPSSNWNNVYWKQDPMEPASSDSSVLTISAYNINREFQQKIDLEFSLNDSLLNLNSLIDANSFPYISLSALHQDTLSTTPAQIDRWHVLYSPLPEAAIDGSTAHYWSQPSDTLQEGDSFDFAIDIRNIFNLDMDSLKVNYWVEDQSNMMHPINYPRQDSLRIGEVLRDTITISTTGITGLNSLWIEANPYSNGVLDQPEQLHWNNIVQIPFYVNGDDVNPILDVTFNGNHILNGDIIDPTSEILITLKDDNEFLIMNDVSDTTLFGVYLTDPTGNQKRVYFQNANGETNMQWIPANAQNKKFQIIWNEEFETDGKYTLLVQGTDRSGNVSGDIEYRITFEIVHESTITNMMNYPNPFSTSTRFVFTLTGSEVPDDIIIQIMTVSGRVIREITEDELGMIQIGRNITEYAWDGTDEFGDPLANGVYLYRVFAKIGGEEIKHRESGADTHFKKDFGKMYIIR